MTQDTFEANIREALIEGMTILSEIQLAVSDKSGKGVPAAQTVRNVASALSQETRKNYPVYTTLAEAQANDPSLRVGLASLVSSPAEMDDMDLERSSEEIFHELTSASLTSFLRVIQILAEPKLDTVLTTAVNAVQDTGINSLNTTMLTTSKDESFPHNAAAIALHAYYTSELGMPDAGKDKLTGANGKRTAGLRRNIVCEDFALAYTFTRAALRHGFADLEAAIPSSQKEAFKAFVASDKKDALKKMAILGTISYWNKNSHIAPMKFIRAALKNLLGDIYDHTTGLNGGAGNPTASAVGEVMDSSSYSGSYNRTSLNNETIQTLVYIPMATFCENAIEFLSAPDTYIASPDSKSGRARADAGTFPEFVNFYRGHVTNITGYRGKVNENAINHSFYLPGGTQPASTIILRLGVIVEKFRSATLSSKSSSTGGDYPQRGGISEAEATDLDRLALLLGHEEFPYGTRPTAVDVQNWAMATFDNDTITSTRYNPIIRKILDQPELVTRALLSVLVPSFSQKKEEIQASSTDAHTLDKDGLAATDWAAKTDVSLLDDGSDSVRVVTHDGVDYTLVDSDEADQATATAESISVDTTVLEDSEMWRAAIQEELGGGSLVKMSAITDFQILTAIYGVANQMSYAAAAAARSVVLNKHELRIGGKLQKATHTALMRKVTTGMHNKPTW